MNAQLRKKLVYGGTRMRWFSAWLQFEKPVNTISNIWSKSGGGMSTDAQAAASSKMDARCSSVKCWALAPPKGARLFWRLIGSKSRLEGFGRRPTRGISVAKAQVRLDQVRLDGALDQLVQPN